MAVTRKTRLHVKLAADYFDDDDIIDAGEKAELLYVRGLAFCARRRSQDISHGQFTQRVAAGISDAESAADRLVAAGLWEATPRGYRVPRQGPPRRAAIPRRIREFVMRRDGGRCVECKTTEDLTLDHIWPWSLGGADTAENLRVLCRPCNSAKGANV